QHGAQRRAGPSRAMSGPPFHVCLPRSVRAFSDATTRPTRGIHGCRPITLGQPMRLISGNPHGGGSMRERLAMRLGRRSRAAPPLHLERPTGGLPYAPSLDGLRAIAVAAVLLYHGGALPGGFLGVDLFFVLSGFLITSLLLAETARSGRVDLRRFWTR